MKKKPVFIFGTILLLFFMICFLSIILIFIHLPYPQNKPLLMHTQKVIYHTFNLESPKKPFVRSKKKKPSLPLLKIKQESFQIPGLSKSYEFLFLADSHLSIPDPKHKDQNIQDYLKSRVFGNTTGILSKEIFPSFIVYANQNQLDAVLMGGDIIDSPAPSNLEYLNNQLDELSMPYLYTMGNHDWTFPWEYFSQTAVSTYIPSVEEVTGEANLVHYIEYDDLIVASIDNSTNQVSLESFQAFQSLEQKKKPIILLMHVPINTPLLAEKSIDAWGKAIALGEGGVSLDLTTYEFLQFVQREDSMVQVILSGHLHLYHKEALKNGQLQFVAAPAFEGSGLHLTLSP